MCLNPSWCVMCKKDQESIRHLFIHCDFARHLWSKVFNEFGVIMDVSNNLKDLFQGFRNALGTKIIRALWVTVVGLFCGVSGKKGIQEHFPTNTSLFSICGIKFCIG